MKQAPTSPVRRLPAAVRCGLWLALAIAAYANLVHWVLKPLHAHGVGQPVLGYLNGLDHLFQATGFRMTALLGLHAGRHVTDAAEGLAVAGVGGLWEDPPDHRLSQSAASQCNSTPAKYVPDTVDFWPGATL